MKSLIFVAVLQILTTASFSAQIDYGLKVMDKSGKAVTLKEYEGKQLLILYYSMTCGKCKKAVADLATFMSKKNCMQIVGIVTSSEEEKKYLSDKVKRPFVSYYDKWKNFKTAYGVEQVPLLIVADSKGSVIYKDDHYYEESFYELLNAFNLKICEKQGSQPTLQDKYLGATVCAACHTSIGSWWKETKHAKAYDAVAKKYFARSGFRKEYADRVPPEVLEKSTTGYMVATGYDPVLHQKSLLGVQCEACHTAGGPHDGKTTRDMQGQCTKCHTSAEDPTFEYRSALRKLAHPKERK